MSELQGALVRLRPVTDADIPELARIRRTPEVHEHWRGGDDMVAEIQKDLAEPESNPLVIELDGRVVGWIQWEEEEDPDYRHASIDIYVDPAFHRRGIGTDAMRTLGRHLIVDRGHHRLVIDPAAHNAPAIACYTKVGFRPVGILRQAEIGNDGTWHDSLFMDLLADELVE
jgi:aminoglycoside 6'-N-acetyltransferase